MKSPFIIFTTQRAFKNIACKGFMFIARHRIAPTIEMVHVLHVFTTLFHTSLKQWRSVVTNRSIFYNSSKDDKRYIQIFFSRKAEWVSFLIIFPTQQREYKIFWDHQEDSSIGGTKIFKLLCHLKDNVKERPNSTILINMLSCEKL